MCKPYQSFLVSDIAIFLLKRDVKLQLTNYQSFLCKMPPRQICNSVTQISTSNNNSGQRILTKERPHRTRGVSPANKNQPLTPSVASRVCIIMHLSIPITKICITWDPSLLTINLHYKRSIACSQVLGTHYPRSRPMSQAIFMAAQYTLHYSQSLKTTHVHGWSKDALYTSE